jgi:hypothetical protein
VTSRLCSINAAALLLAAVLAGPAAAAAPAKAAPPAPTDAGARARAILADPRYQRALPGSTPGDKEDGGGPSPWQGRGRRGGDVAPGDDGSAPPPEMFQIPEALAVVIKWVLILVALAVLGLLVVGVWRAFERDRERKAGAADAAPPEEEPGRRERSPAGDEAERLAAEGRWGEALHALLLQAIRHLTAGSPVALRASYTSRELLRLVPLPGEARQAFAGLVRAVELSLFGGAPVGPDEYRENRERFQLLRGGSR